MAGEISSYCVAYHDMQNTVPTQKYGISSGKFQFSCGHPHSDNSLCAIVAGWRPPGRHRRGDRPLKIFSGARSALNLNQVTNSSDESPTVVRFRTRSAFGLRANALDTRRVQSPTSVERSAARLRAKSITGAAPLDTNSSCRVTLVSRTVDSNSPSARDNGRPDAVGRLDHSLCASGDTLSSRSRTLPHRIGGSRKQPPTRATRAKAFRSKLFNPKSKDWRVRIPMGRFSSLIPLVLHLLSPLSLAHSLSIKYPFPTREVSNALTTSLELRLYTVGDDHLFSGGSHAC
ncbi:hypothetical protein EVAR_4924_1 [Eumeta japonica]|uniref:Uncharacterized protein n=1 Tax=Eumeta variegata TaxID=151549 RepID=A0A4C1Y028_EUMVA|nr:hypothetical protein EVAR_4924_1 [Eumeta japonica]